MQLRNEDEIDSPTPIEYIVTHEVEVGEDDVTPEEVVEAMNSAKEYLEGEGVTDVKFRASYEDGYLLEAYGYRMEDETEAAYRNIRRSYIINQRDNEYFNLKAERERLGLPL